MVGTGDRTWLREKICELEDMTTETFKPKGKEEKPARKNSEYPKTVGQLQKVSCTTNGNTRKRRQTERNKKYLRQ